MTSFQAVRLQNEYRSLLTTSASAAVNIGRVNAVIYVVVMESRGIYMSTEPAKVKQFSDKLHMRNRELAGVVRNHDIQPLIGARRFGERQRSRAAIQLVPAQASLLGCGDRGLEQQRHSAGVRLPRAPY